MQWSINLIHGLRCLPGKSTQYLIIATKENQNALRDTYIDHLVIMKKLYAFYFMVCFSQTNRLHQFYSLAPALNAFALIAIHSLFV